MSLSDPKTARLIPDHPLSGGLFPFPEPEFTTTGPNLTPDIATGIGGWTEEQFVTAMQSGVRPDGRVLLPFMPWPSYARWSRDDLHAVCLYLRSLKPASHRVPPSVLKNTGAEAVGRPLPVKRVVDIARGAAEGLSAAHDKGIVHRDLKPENLFVTKNGRVKILDFGLAKLRSEVGPQQIPSNDQLTQAMAPGKLATGAGIVLGTVGYMSPEQVRGEPLDSRSDIFALGVILWEMFTGDRPFKGPSAVECMNAILKDEPPDPDPALKLPPVLERIAHTCLAKEPVARFHSAHDLAFALDNLSSGSYSSAHPIVSPPQRRRKMMV